MRPRPVPEDFAEIASARTILQIAKHYGTGKNLILRWLHESGVRTSSGEAGGWNRRKVPADFAARAAELNVAGLRTHYAAGSITIARWLHECRTRAARVNASRPPVPKKRQPPDDFARIAPLMSRTRLREHYHASSEVVARWVAETGIESKKTVDHWRGFGTSPSLAAMVGPGTADQAAQFLRRSLPNVYRAEISDRKRKGEYFVAGHGFIPTAEMIALAEQRGFTP